MSIRTPIDLVILKRVLFGSLLLLLSACGSDGDLLGLDITAPTISLNGTENVTVEAGSVYNDAGATATDDMDGDISADILVTGVVDTSTLGTYTLTYSVSDAAGNAATPVTRNVEVVDTTAPVISLNGTTRQSVALGSTYTDPGATAIDNLDGDVTVNILVTGTVDTSTLGTYTLTYSVSDSIGNVAEVTRSVTVADQTAPVISLNGQALITIAHGATYTDPGATAMDNLDGDISADIQLSGSVDTNRLGTYTLTYNVSDAAGNAATPVTRRVMVADQTAPVINLNGAALVTIEAGSIYMDAGAVASDNVDETVTVNVSGNVNSGQPGSYILTYSAVDAAGNAATPVTRTVVVIDTISPVISLTGDANQSVALGSSYADPGATAIDIVDGDLSASIVVTGSVDTNTVGNYTLTYNVSDTAGNAATPVTRTVTVADQSAPVITLTGNASVTVAHGSVYTDAGATASDNLDGDLSTSIVVTGTVDTNTVGNYTLTYNVSDTAGNAATPVTRTVTVADQSAPVITLTGNASVTVAQGDTYTDAGATAIDIVDGDLSASIVVTGNVDTNTAGSYTLTYNVSDTAGNAATPVTRTVTVADLTAPMITLTGNASVTVAYGSVYTDAGATASDNLDGDITASIVVTGTVDTNTVGNYTLTYNVSDAAGNAATPVTRTVTVADLTAPVITLTGNASVTVAQGSVYTDAGATATDAVDGDLSASIVVTGTVDTNTVGSYTLTYNVSDAAGNAATPVTRTVTVADQTAPVISLNGAALVTIEAGSSYTDAGATASDNVDGDISTSIVVTGSVDSNTVGSYTLTYNVSDAAGNAATPVTRTVTVTDTTAPVITLTGSASVTVAHGSVYTDTGASATDNADGDLSTSIVVTGTVDTNTVGSYTLTYNVSDAAGNAATPVTRTVTVADQTPPVILLIGGTNQTVAQGGTYTDPGATASDTVDGDISASIVVTGTVDTSTEGTYTLTYNVSDAAGNAATPVTRSVVVDGTPPVITLTGGAAVSVALGETYTDAGATASDNLDGDITADIVVTGSVDTTTLGTYTLTYNVSDAVGNAATAVTRTVTVVTRFTQFVPGFNNDVEIIAPAADGSGDIYVGGSFTNYKVSTVGHIARLNSDGTVDSAFVTGSGFNASVQTIAPATDGSGDIYVGGNFTAYNGSAVNRIARLNSDGSLDSAFVSGTGFNNTVYTIAPATDGSGDIYMGGYFTDYNGSAVSRIARLNSDGSLDSTFVIGTGFDSLIYTIAPATDGSGDIYVGGGFTAYNGSTVNNIARLNSDGSLDSAFVSGTGFNNTVYTIAPAVDGSGDIYVGGEFFSYNGSTVGRIARLNSDGSLDSTFVIGTGFGNIVYTIAPATDGSGDIYVGGGFFTYNGSTVRGIARLNSDGSRDSTFVTGSGFLFADVFTIAPATDGSGDIYVGGDFTAYNGSSLNNIVRLNSDGSLDSAFVAATGFNNDVQIIAPATDGSGDIYVGGQFSGYADTAVGRIARLNSDGSLDSTFVSGSGFNNTVYTIAPATDGSGDIYVVGRFSNYNGSAVGGIARLNSDGSLDSTFATGTGFNGSFSVWTIAPAADGSGDIYVGGNFNLYNGSAVNQIVRLNSDGSLDSAFVTGSGFDDGVGTITPATDGSGDIYVGGDFTNYNGSTVGRIARLNSDGSLDSAFVTGSGFNSLLLTIVPAADGSGDIYVGGFFTDYNGSAVGRIARLNSDGSLDSTFMSGSGFNSTVYTIAPATDGSGDIYVGGYFYYNYNGSAVNKIARLNSDGSLDSAFVTGSGFDDDIANIVDTIAPVADGSGNLYVGGRFLGYQGKLTGPVVRLNSLGDLN